MDKAKGRITRENVLPMEDLRRHLHDLLKFIL
jgi:hypothetical protein